MLVDQGGPEFLRGAGAGHSIDLQHNSLLSLPNDEVDQSLAGVLPVDTDIPDDSPGWAVIAQRNELLQTLVLTRGDGLNTVVGKVTDPARQTKLTSAVTDKETEPHALDPAT